MGEKTKIEWCDHTFNPWIGCTKIAQGCHHCYAEAFAKRTGLAKWSYDGTRVKTSESNWRQPLKWSREAEAAGERRRVFCASLSDVFEEWTGNIVSSRGEVQWWRNDKGVVGAGATTINHSRGERLAIMDDVRDDLFKLIDATPNLDWLLLTKRPENIGRMWPTEDNGAGKLIRRRDNVWLGTSISNQDDADRNIPTLLKCRDLAKVLFVSAEPLIGPVDLCHVQHDGTVEIDALNGTHGVRRPHGGKSASLDWVIVGGESGPKSRVLMPASATSIRDQCLAARTPFFFKQWGEYCVPSQMTPDTYMEVDAAVNLSAMPEEYYRVGKKRAGDLLDGVQWHQFPEAR